MRRLSLGTWNLTTLGSLRKAMELLEDAWELGIRQFDTANVYGFGESERLLGRFLGAHDLHSAAFVTTKAYWPVGPGPNQGGLSYKHLRGQVEVSMRRLGVDHLDCLMAHRYDERTGVEGFLAAVRVLLRSGKLQGFSVSEWPTQELSCLLDYLTSDPLLKSSFRPPQYQLSLLWRQRSIEMGQLLGEHSTGLSAWSPLAEGALTGRWTPALRSRASDGRDRTTSSAKWFQSPLVSRQIETVGRMVMEYGIPLEEFALAWVLDQTVTDSVVFGASRRQHIENAVRATTLRVDPDVGELAKQLLPDLSQVHRLRT